MAFLTIAPLPSIPSRIVSGETAFLRLLDIATGRVGDARVSVPTAHFLASIREGIEDDYKGKTVPEHGESAAARALKMLPPTRSAEYRAKRTTVTEEMTVKGMTQLGDRGRFGDSIAKVPRKGRSRRLGGLSPGTDLCHRPLSHRCRIGRCDSYGMQYSRLRETILGESRELDVLSGW